MTERTCKQCRHAQWERYKSGPKKGRIKMNVTGRCRHPFTFVDVLHIMNTQLPACFPTPPEMERRGIWLNEVHQCPLFEDLRQKEWDSYDRAT